MQAISSNKVKNIFHPVLSCSVLSSVQWEEKRASGDEMRQRILILNYSENFFHGKYQMVALPGKQCFFVQCHLPCSLTVANKISLVVPSRSSPPALFPSSPLLLPHDVGSSCGQSPQLPPAPVAGAVLGLCWDGPIRTWHLCARQSEPPLNKRGIFLPKVFTACMEPRTLCLPILCTWLNTAGWYVFGKEESYGLVLLLSAALLLWGWVVLGGTCLSLTEVAAMSVSSLDMYHVFSWRFLQLWTGCQWPIK